MTLYRGMNSTAPELTFDTTGVKPHAFLLLTITPSTPINMALRRMLPKFYGSVTWSRNKKNLPCGGSSAPAYS